MQTQTLIDRANAPTAILITRDYHRIATLGHNKIIQDYHTQTLKAGERVTKLLPRPQTKRPRQKISTALKQIFGFLKLSTF